MFPYGNNIPSGMDILEDIWPAFSYSFFSYGHRDQIAYSLLGGFSKPIASDTHPLDSVPY